MKKKTSQCLGPMITIMRVHVRCITMYVWRLWGFPKEEVWSTSWDHLQMSQWADVNDI